MSLVLFVSDPSTNQHHVGLAHSSEDEVIREFLHLAWHRRLKNEGPPDDCLLIEPDVPQPTLVQAAAWCRKVIRKNPVGIPYGFSAASECFTDEGVFQGAPHRFGLTCATFVLAIFHASKYPLVNYAGWPPPTGKDFGWQAKVISDLESQIPTGYVTQEHVENARTEIGKARFYPTQVGAAAMLDDHPAEFEPVNETAELLEAALLKGPP